MELTQRTDGFTGADLENLCNEVYTLILMMNTSLTFTLPTHYLMMNTGQCWSIMWQTIAIRFVGLLQ